VTELPDNRNRTVKRARVRPLANPREMMLQANELERKTRGKVRFAAPHLPLSDALCNPQPSWPLGSAFGEEPVRSGTHIHHQRNVQYDGGRHFAVNNGPQGCLLGCRKLKDELVVDLEQHP